MVYVYVKSWLSILVVVNGESEDHVNIGSVSIWDEYEPLRMTSTLAVTTLNASIERSA